MRHRKSGRQLNRNSSHRRADFRNMSASLIEHEVIRTTLPKARELRRYIEPLITLARQDNVANRRLAFARLRNDDAVGKLFFDLGVRFRNRNGGYLSILKDGVRTGDKAPMAAVQLLDRPERIDTAFYARQRRFAGTVQPPASPDVAEVSAPVVPTPAEGDQSTDRDESQKGWLSRIFTGKKNKKTDSESDEDSGKNKS